jgi:hypothetical protein
MAFQHSSAPVRAWTEELLSADNTKPDRFTLIDTLRRAASSLDLSPSVIATVDALLSCLPPKREHDIVFASALVVFVAPCIVALFVGMVPEFDGKVPAALVGVLCCAVLS